MIIFLYGPDTFRSRQQLHNMREKFKQDRDPQGLNVVCLDAEKESAGTIDEQIRAIPFLAEKRMVILENFIASTHDTLRKNLLSKIEEQTISAQTILVFWEAKETFRKKEQKEFLARLVQEKYAQYFELFDGAKLEGWIAAEIADKGAQIQQEALIYLAEHIGNDMWQLNSLIDQLIAYANGRDITKQDTMLFIDEKVDDNIFNLIDAIVAKHAQKVFSMMQEQYRQGKDPHYIFAMLLRQYRILLQIKDLLEKGTSHSQTLAKSLKLHPFVIKKSLPLANTYSKQDLTAIYDQLLTFDIHTKTGQGDRSVLLDRLVGKLCSD